MFLTKFDQVGFNKLLKDVQDGLIDSPSISKVYGSKFPFSDICVDENNTMFIEIAVAGFSKDDLDISKEDDMLVIKGTVAEEILEEDALMKYYQKEIAKRNFVKKFKLAKEYAMSEDICATTNNGILMISIKPVKEFKSTSKISIQ